MKIQLGFYFENMEELWKVSAYSLENSHMTLYAGLIWGL